jgi:hypothetical protein
LEEDNLTSQAFETALGKIKLTGSNFKVFSDLQTGAIFIQRSSTKGKSIMPKISHFL